MKQSYTMYIYKLDRRCKTGERLFSTTVWKHRDEAEMKREIRELQYKLYPESDFRFEFFPTTVTVRSLMNGAEVALHHTEVGTCCDPSTERYWSM